MRIVWVLVVGIILIFTISVGWYVSQPVVMGVASAVNNSITNENGRVIAKGVQYVSFAWGPVLDLFILLWMAISAQKRDVESEVYG